MYVTSQVVYTAANHNDIRTAYGMLFTFVINVKKTAVYTHQVEASPKGGLAQPPKINSQNMTVHDPSVCVASVVFQVHS